MSIGRRVTLSILLATASFAMPIAGCTALVGDGNYFVSNEDAAAADATVDASTSDAVSKTHDSPAVDSSSPDTTGDVAEAGGCLATELSCGGACVASDAHNCGACGHDCTSLANLSGPASCDPTGQCVFAATACTAGWTHCTSNPDDGCETDITQASHCGSCINTCPAPAPLCVNSGGGYACTSTCPSTTPTTCSGACIDTTSNASN
jgi:hypothetical protein